MQIHPETFDGVVAGAAAQYWMRLNAFTYVISHIVAGTRALTSHLFRRTLRRPLQLPRQRTHQHSQLYRLPERYRLFSNRERTSNLEAEAVQRRGWQRRGGR